MIASRLRRGARHTINHARTSPLPAPATRVWQAMGNDGAAATPEVIVPESGAAVEPRFAGSAPHGWVIVWKHLEQWMSGLSGGASAPHTSVAVVPGTCVLLAQLLVQRAPHCTI